MVERGKRGGREKSRGDRGEREVDEGLMTIEIFIE